MEDLVLHEGNGKVRRPSCTQTQTTSGNKNKRMPSPRKLRVTSTPSTKSNTRASSSEETSNNTASYPQNNSNNNKNNNSNFNNTTTNKSGMEEFFAKVRRRKSSVVVAAPTTHFFDEGSEAEYSYTDDEDDDDDDDDSTMMYEDNHHHTTAHDTFHNQDASTSRRIIQQQQRQQQQQQVPYEHTKEDIAIYQRLDDEYERALEERDIGYNARYASIRQTALWSVFVLVVFMAQGTYCYHELLLFEHNKKYKQFHHNIIAEGGGEEEDFDTQFNNWSIPESLLFSIFTITTVGYGREDLPTTASFQAYTICYLLLGIAALTIMVAQVFQCIALEASRARLSQDKIEQGQGKNRGGRRSNSGLMRMNSPTTRTPTPTTTSPVPSATTPTRRRHQGRGDLPPNSSPPHHPTTCTTEEEEEDIILSQIDTRSFVPKSIDQFFRCLDKAKYFFQSTELGKGISVIIPFAGLILSGALVVGPLEEWSFLESLYFAVVSLTTVGFGDYVPTHLGTIWFCIFWLPCSIGFMSLYLGNIANFYIRLSNKNIRRIERRLRRRLEKAKEQAEKERAEVLQRAYRGQEAEIASVAAANTTNTNTTTRRKQEEKGTTGIPMNHARSVLSRRRRQHNARRRPGFDMLPTSELEGDDSDEEQGTDVLGGSGSTHHKNHVVDVLAVDAGCRRRERIIENCRVIPPDDCLESDSDTDTDTEDVATVQHASSSSRSSRSQAQAHDPSVKSMKDVIRAVRNTINSKNAGVMSHCGGGGGRGDSNNNNTSNIATTHSCFVTTNHQSTTPTKKNRIDYSIFRKGKNKKPSFALRVLIQERFAKIIAIEVAGYHSFIDIKDHTFSVTIDSMSETAEKWFIPRRARKAFRTVALEIIYFVGEHGLITRGANALYDLTPFEFHGLFSALVAAMGDADTMEGWLAKTDTLARVDLQRRGVLQRSAPLGDRTGGRFATTDEHHHRGGGGGVGGARQRVLSNEYV